MAERIKSMQGLDVLTTIHFLDPISGHSLRSIFVVGTIPVLVVMPQTPYALLCLRVFMYVFHWPKMPSSHTFARYYLLSLQGTGLAPVLLESLPWTTWWSRWPSLCLTYAPPCYDSTFTLPPHNRITFFVGLAFLL